MKQTINASMPITKYETMNNKFSHKCMTNYHNKLQLTTKPQADQH